MICLNWLNKYSETLSQQKTHGYAKFCFDFIEKHLKYKKHLCSNLHQPNSSTSRLIINKC